MVKSKSKMKALAAEALTVPALVKLSQIRTRMRKDYPKQELAEEMSEQLSDSGITWGGAAHTIVSKGEFLGGFDLGDYQDYAESILSLVEYVDMEN